MNDKLPMPFSVTLAVWRRATAEAIWLLAGCMLMMFAFHWLYVYLTSLISGASFASFFDELPDSMGGMLGISIAEAATPRGRIALGYVDPTPVIIAVVWGVTRGSDAVSGPLDRGTLELTLAQPVSRLSVLFANIGVTIFGAALIALAAWLGTCAGIATVSVPQEGFFNRLFFGYQNVPLTQLVAYREFLPAAINLFSLTVLVGGYTTLISACDRFRWRTIGIAGSFTLIQIVMKMAGLAARDLQWLFQFTFLGAYWPQTLALAGSRTWDLSLQYNGTLLGIAVFCFLAAAVIFSRRDLPAPL
jgi:ABC-2 type transport system permease protein